MSLPWAVANGLKRLQVPALGKDRDSNASANNVKAAAARQTASSYSINETAGQAKTARRFFISNRDWANAVVTLANRIGRPNLGPRWQIARFPSRYTLRRDNPREAALQVLQTPCQAGRGLVPKAGVCFKRAVTGVWYDAMV